MVRFPRLAPINAIASTLAAALAPMMERRSEDHRLTAIETAGLFHAAEAIRRVEDEVEQEGKSRAPVTVSGSGRSEP
jgi:hypothetical protein